MMSAMSAIKGRAQRVGSRPASPSVLLQGRVSIEAHAAARAAADEAGISIAAYLDALVLADAELRIVRPSTGYKQEALPA